MGRIETIVRVSGDLGSGGLHWGCSLVMTGSTGSEGGSRRDGKFLENPEILAAGTYWGV